MDRPKIQKKSVAVEVRNNFMGVVINTTAYHLGRYSLRLLLLHEELHGTTVSFRLRKFCIIWAVIVAQLAEWSLLISDICCSFPVSGIFSCNCIEETKIKGNDARNVSFLHFDGIFKVDNISKYCVNQTKR